MLIWEFKGVTSCKSSRSSGWIAQQFILWKHDDHPPADRTPGTHLVLDVGMKSFQHPLTGVLVGQEWLHLQTQMFTQMSVGGKKTLRVCVCPQSQAILITGPDYVIVNQS